MQKLTKKEQAFVHEYLQTFNRTQAYLKVYNCKNINNARSDSYKILQKPHVKKYLQELERERDDEMIAKTNEVLSLLTHVARRTERDSDRIKACELLLKASSGVFTKQEEENKEFNVKVEVVGDVENIHNPN